ncbi:acyltransferase family protein [Candidatus Pelagibacter sp. HIMB1611]|uniref:acyltransferase family protein n=1 Tax=unclassified Candidatus Pelagibacter TaxID=2647897 RepID=UPI003F837CC7
MNKINNLESLRGIAALIVALFHLPALSFYHIESGWLGVYFFFSLSGFVIALNYFEKIKDWNSLINFKKKRFFRLYPVHIFVLILVLLIQIGKIFLVDLLGISYEQKAFQPSEWFTKLDFFQHIFLTQSVTNMGYHLSWNAAAWTISTEFYTYLIFSLIILSVKNNEIVFSIIVILYVIFFDSVSHFLKPYVNFLLLDCLRYFLVGSLMYLIFKKIKFRINDFFVLSIISLIIYYNTILPNYIIYSSIVLLIATQKKENYIYKLLNQKYLVYFGTISYSFYMIHHVAFYILNQFLKIININFYTGITQYNFFLDTALTILYIVIGIVASILMYKFIENKIRIK